MADDLSMSPVERAIRQAMRAGLFDDLPGKGKPLKWRPGDDARTPREARMANKIMLDNDIAPSWMVMGQALTRQEEKLRTELARGLRAYLGALRDAETGGDLGRRSRVVRTWESLLNTFHEAAAQYNRNVLTYNIMVPPGVPRREMFRVEEELKKLRG